MNKKECREQKGGRAGFAKHTRKSCTKPSFHISSPGGERLGRGGSKDFSESTSRMALPPCIAMGALTPPSRRGQAVRRLESQFAPGLKGIRIGV